MAAKFYHDQLLLLQALSLLEYCNDIDPDIFVENILKMLIKIFWIFMTLFLCFLEMNMLIGWEELSTSDWMTVIIFYFEFY